MRLASSGAEGLELARALPFDAAIVDIMMPGIDGIATLDELKRIDEDLPVVMITAYASVESAISAMKPGAFDYITKPFKNDEVLVVVRNAMERRRLVHENRDAAPEHPGAVPQVREHHRRQPADAAGVRPDHPGGAEPVDDPDPGRERHGQGAGGARDPRQLVARPTGRSSRSTRAICRRICSSRRSSATSRARSPAPSIRRRACSTWPTRAPSSSTRSATFRSRRRPSCCA